jgi:hypothetical protein
MVTVTGLEWPVPTHAPIFSIPDLKSKPGMRLAAIASGAENSNE